MKKRIAIWAIILTIFSGCYKNHLYVQQEWVDRNFLASSRVGTPDPRQEHPPEGQRLLICWKFPENIFNQDLRFAITVRYWDNSEELISYPLNKQSGYATFNCFKMRILTYRVQVIDRWDEVVEVWEHHFWTELIDIDRRSD